LAEAKAFMTGSYVVDLETAGSVAARVLTQAVFGLPEDYYTRYRERIQALTREEIAAAVQRHIDPAKLTVAVAGDAARFGKQLGKHGRVKMIPLEKLDLLARGLERK
jgi:zinc protease